MADYDLGTAHGTIVVDYKDKGTKEAQKDLQSIADKARSLLTQFSAVRKKWAAESQGIVADTERIARSMGILAGAVSAASGLLLKTGSTLGGLRGSLLLVSSLGMALGALPNGTQNFPRMIQNIIRLSASITFFAGATALLARTTRNIAVLGTLTGMFGRFGQAVFNAAGPLRMVAGAALNVATVFAQLRLVKGLIKPFMALNGVLGGLAAGLYAVAYAATGLWQALTQLAGVVGLVPAAIGVAALAIGTFKVGIQGLDEAFKNMSDPKKFAEALKNLAPAAREFATAVRDQSGAFKELRLDVQQRMFEGVGQMVQTLAGKYMPLLRTNMAGVATTINQTVLSLGRMLATPDVFGHMTSAGTKFRQILANLAAAVTPLVEALIVIMDVGASVFLELTGGAGAAAQRFRDFIQAAAETGKLRAWIEGGVQGFRDLWAIMKNVGNAIKTIFVGMNGGEGANFLATIRDATAAFNEFLKSAQGQAILGMIGDVLRQFADNVRALGDAFMTYVVPAIEAFLPLIQRLSEAFNAGIVTAIGILAPLFTALGTAMSFLAPITGPIVQGLVTMAVVFAGLAIAAKLIMAQLLLLRTGLMVLKGAWTVAAFGARLFTGNLRSGEAAVLRFIGLLIKNMFLGVINWVKGIAMMIASNIALAASWVATKAVLIAQWVAMRVAAAAHAVATGAVWLAQAIAARVALVAAWIATRAAIIAQWIALRAVALAHAIAVGAVWLMQTIISTAQIVAAWVAAKAMIVAQWIALRAVALANAIGYAIAWVVQTTIATAQMVAAWVVARVALIAGWIALKAASLANAIGYALAWVTSTITATVSMVAAWAVARAAIIAGWIAMRVAAMASAIQMAAAWLIALGPIGLLIAAVAVVVVLIIMYWDQIKAAISTALTFIGNLLSTVWNAIWATIGPPIMAAWAIVQAAMQQIQQAIAIPIAIIQTIVSAGLAVIQALFSGNFSAIPQIVGNAARMILSLMQQGMAQLGNAVNQGIQRVIQFFVQLGVRALAELRNLAGRMVAAGVDIINGIVRGLQSAAGRVISFLTGLAQRALNAVKSFFGIASPSKVMAEVGQNVGQGLANGILGMVGATVRAARYLSDETAAAINPNVTPNLNLAAARRATGAGAAPLPYVGGMRAASPALAAGTVGGDGTTFTGPISVTIPAKDIAEMKSVSEFFDKVQQTARAGKATR